jgi:ribosomal protein L37AE/L43A
MDELAKLYDQALEKTSGFWDEPNPRQETLDICPHCNSANAVSRISGGMEVLLCPDCKTVTFPDGSYWDVRRGESDRTLVEWALEEEGLLKEAGFWDPPNLEQIKLEEQWYEQRYRQDPPCPDCGGKWAQLPDLSYFDLGIECCQCGEYGVQVAREDRQDAIDDMRSMVEVSDYVDLYRFPEEQWADFMASMRGQRTAGFWDENDPKQLDIAFCPQCNSTNTARFDMHGSPFNQEGNRNVLCFDCGKRTYDDGDVIEDDSSAASILADIDNGAINGRRTRQASLEDQYDNLVKTAADTDAKLLQQSQWYADNYNLPDATQVVHQFPDGWTIKQLGCYGDAQREGLLMSNCLKYPYDADAYAAEIWAWHPNKQAIDANAGPSLDDLDEDIYGGSVYSLRDPSDLPRVTIYDDGNGGTPILGRHNSEPKPEYWEKIVEWDPQLSQWSPSLSKAKMGGFWDEPNEDQMSWTICPQCGSGKAVKYEPVGGVNMDNIVCLDCNTRTYDEGTWQYSGETHTLPAGTMRDRIADDYELRKNSGFWDLPNENQINLLKPVTFEDFEKTIARHGMSYDQEKAQELLDLALSTMTLRDVDYIAERLREVGYEHFSEALYGEYMGPPWPSWDGDNGSDFEEWRSGNIEGYPYTGNDEDFDSDHAAGTMEQNYETWQEQKEEQYANSGEFPYYDIGLLIDNALQEEYLRRRNSKVAGFWDGPDYNQGELLRSCMVRGCTDYATPGGAKLCPDCLAHRDYHGIGGGNGSRASDRSEVDRWLEMERTAGFWDEPNYDQMNLMFCPQCGNTDIPQGNYNYGCLKCMTETSRSGKTWDLNYHSSELRYWRKVYKEQGIPIPSDVSDGRTAGFWDETPEGQMQAAICPGCGETDPNKVIRIGADIGCLTCEKEWDAHTGSGYRIHDTVYWKNAIKDKQNLDASGDWNQYDGQGNYRGFEYSFLDPSNPGEVEN